MVPEGTWGLQTQSREKVLPHSRENHPGPQSLCLQRRLEHKLGRVT